MEPESSLRHSQASATVGEIYGNNFFFIYVLKWYIFEIVGTIVISLRINKLFSFRDVGSTFLSAMA